MKNDSIVDDSLNLSWGVIPEKDRVRLEGGI